MISQRCFGKKLSADQRKKLSIASKRRTPVNKGVTYSKDSVEYQRIYGNRRVQQARFTLDEVKLVIADYEFGLPFVDLTKKYGRRLQQIHINALYRRLNETPKER